jgi:hypothetical protein
MKMHMRVCPAALMFCAAVLLQAQNAPDPTRFRDLALGMSLEDVKTRLKADSLFSYRGEPDVSLVPQTEQTLIECGGTSFIQRAYFQFEKESFSS